MRPSWQRVVAAALCAAALAACRGAPGPGAAPGSQPSAPLQPFRLLIASIDAQTMGSGAILGAPADLLNPEAVRIATEASRAALEGYLNAQFVTADTRFSAAPVDGLLGPRAAALLDDTARRGLGVVDLPVLGGVTRHAIAHAVVLVEGPAAYAVTLSYEAVLEVTLGDGGSGPVVQRGSMTFVPIGGGYRAEAVDVTLELPQEPTAAPAAPAPGGQGP
ncbi:MAG TPA: hypothetical protein VG452_03645 [Egibacteraceae bacterium]|nr:hypothetical protein [Egibacteraceae bacterium]